MPLSWNEIRHRAIAFSKEWKGETREAAERQSFWNDFFNVFGVRRRTVATFEEPVKKLSGDWGSSQIVYNNYPWPTAATDNQRAAVETAAQAVLDTRAQYPTSTLADLYDPLTMPAPLLKAHQELDRAVDRCYRPEPFDSDRPRVEYLFALYEKITAPLVAAARPRGKRRKPNAA